MDRPTHKRGNHEKPCLISCGVLQPEIERLQAQKELKAEVIFLNKYLHTDYKKLLRALKASLHKHRDKRPIVVYGDVCLGFQNEMKELADEYGVVKVDGLNCIDCLLGGRGKLLEIDPAHVYLFLTPAFIDFLENYMHRPKKEIRKMFEMLEGIILIDTLGDLEKYGDRIEQISDRTGLPVLEHKDVGLSGLKTILLETLARASHRAA